MMKPNFPTARFKTSLKAFIYSSLRSPKKPRNFSKWDIVLSGSDFAITCLPFRIISDTELTNGKVQYKEKIKGSKKKPEKTGRTLANNPLDAGAKEILDEIYGTSHSA